MATSNPSVKKRARELKQKEKAEAKRATRAEKRFTRARSGDSLDEPASIENPESTLPFA